MFGLSFILKEGQKQQKFPAKQNTNIKMYITQCLLNFISPAACFIVHCVPQLVYRAAMQYLPLLIIQASSSPELSITLDAPLHTPFHNKTKPTQHSHTMLITLQNIE
jgi:hypothetical protein